MRNAENFPFLFGKWRELLNSYGRPDSPFLILKPPMAHLICNIVSMYAFIFLVIVTRLTCKAEIT